MDKDIFALPETNLSGPGFLSDWAQAGKKEFFSSVFEKLEGEGATVQLLSTKHPTETCWIV